MTPAQIARLKELDATRTQGEWGVETWGVNKAIPRTVIVANVCAFNDDEVICEARGSAFERDAVFIAAIANAAPALIEAVERANAGALLRVNADVIAMILSEAGVADAPYLAVKIADELDPPNAPNWDADKVARLYLALDGQPNLTHEATRQIALLKAAADRASSVPSAWRETLEEVEKLRAALTHAVEIIEQHVPRDALGMETDRVDGTASWPLLDEYLHNMRAALQGSAPEQKEQA